MSLTHHEPVTLTGEADTPHVPSGRLDACFGISRRGSTMSREVRGGFATFFTMACAYSCIGPIPDLIG